MKKIAFILVLLYVCLSTGGQTFLRYRMNNNTYNGFYTNNIESIAHDFKDGVATLFVQSLGKMYEIPLADIDHVSVEDASITNNITNDYRIYEFNYDEGDVKRVIVDNRATLFASHNGDFGRNDTILFSSAYNDIACLYYTDDQGRVKKYFDGEKLFYFDYDNDGCKIVDLSDGAYTLIVQNNNPSRAIRRQGALANFFFRQLGNFGDATNYLTGTYQGLLNNQMSNLARSIDEIKSNPELHNQSFIVDGLSIASDVAGIVASCAAEPLTAGWSTAGLLTNMGFLMNDLTSLINHIWPDSEQMKRYRDYYQRKYSIHVAAIAPKNVSYTSATLRGEVTSLAGLTGTFSFRLIGENTETLSGVKNSVTSNSCIVTANASKLKPGWSYFYSLQYTCVVDGLELNFNADNIAEFITLSPTAYTGEVQSKSSDRAEVVCQFYNVPDVASCGVEYSCSDGKAEKRTNSTSNGEKYFTLSPLKPNTKYTYRAFVEIDGIYVYADEFAEFATNNDSCLICPDNNHPHWIDLGLLSGTQWRCCNEGASTPEAYGGYYTFGQVASAPSLDQIKELLNNTTSVWTTQNGVNGRKFTGSNGGTIFLPAAGDRLEGEFYDVGSNCNYWSSTPYGEYLAYYLFFSSGSAYLHHMGRGFGRTVRPVR